MVCYQESLVSIVLNIVSANSCVKSKRGCSHVGYVSSSGDNWGLSVPIHISLVNRTEEEALRIFSISRVLCFRLGYIHYFE